METARSTADLREKAVSLLKESNDQISRTKEFLAKCEKDSESLRQIIDQCDTLLAAESRNSNTEKTNGETV